MGHVIYSTLAADTTYATYTNRGKDRPTIKKMITIQGGALVATKTIASPRGFVTIVNDEDMEHLEANPSFQAHIKNGYISVEKKEIKLDKVVDGMKADDVSTPMTAEILKTKKNAAQPLTKKVV